MKRAILTAALVLASIAMAWSQQGNPKLNGAINREGGVMTLFRAAEPLAIGNVVAATSTYAYGVGKINTSSQDPVAVVYCNASGGTSVNVGSWCWCIHSGPAQVLLDGPATAGNILISSPSTRGTANDIGAPPPPTTAQHFQEIGHLFESKSTATLAWAIVHWN